MAARQAGPGHFLERSNCDSVSQWCQRVSANSLQSTLWYLCKRDMALAIANAQPHRLLQHPLHILLLVSAFPLFLGAFLSDWAYSTTYQVQWINFASWLIAGALVFLGAALLWTFVHALTAEAQHRRAAWVLFILVLVTFVVGFINALVHAKDAGATMPDGLVLSVIVTIFASVSIGYGLVASQKGERA